MKNLITLALAILMCLSVCACTPDDPDVPAVTTDGVSDTAADTAEADTTEAETEDGGNVLPVKFVPTEDNAVFSAEDVTEAKYWGNWTEKSMNSALLKYAENGELYVHDGLSELTATSGEKRIAVRCMYDTDHDSVTEEEKMFPGLHPMYNLDVNVYFLTAEEITAEITRIGEDIGNYPEGRWSIVPISRRQFDEEFGGLKKLYDPEKLCYADGEKSDAALLYGEKAQALQDKEYGTVTFTDSLTAVMEAVEDEKNDMICCYVRYEQKEEAPFEDHPIPFRADGAYLGENVQFFNLQNLRAVDADENTRVIVGVMTEEEYIAYYNWYHFTDRSVPFDVK